MSDVEPVEGELLPIIARCPHCRHPLEEHFRGTGTCMHSTPEETWACSCVGTDPHDGGAPGLPKVVVDVVLGINVVEDDRIPVGMVAIRNHAGVTRLFRIGEDAVTEQGGAVGSTWDDQPHDDGGRPA